MLSFRLCQAILPRFGAAASTRTFAFARSLWLPSLLSRLPVVSAFAPCPVSQSSVFAQHHRCFASDRINKKIARKIRAAARNEAHEASKPAPLPAFPAVTVNHAELNANRSCLEEDTRYPRTQPSEAVLEQVAATPVSVLPSGEEEGKEDDAEEEQGEELQPNESEVTGLHQHSVNRSVDSRELFVVVKIKGRQHKVILNDCIMMNKLDLPVGAHTVFDEVLLVGSKDFTVVGRPVIENVQVHAVVEEQTQTTKVLSFKKRRRTSSSKRLMGHRRLVTIIRISDIVYNGAVPSQSNGASASASASASTASDASTPQTAVIQQ